MYGLESGVSGLGGLAAQQPGGDRFLPAALAIRPRATPLIGGPSSSGVMLPYSGIGDQVATPVVSAGGTAVEVPPDRLADSGWRHLLDWHNSPAPWILLGLLLLYGWLHVSVRASAGRPSGQASVL
jgi:hypothetical protein